MKEAKKKKSETSIGVSSNGSVSALGASFVYVITGLFLAVGLWVARYKFSADLVSDPSLTLFLLWVMESTCFSFCYCAMLIRNVVCLLTFRVLSFQLW